MCEQLIDQASELGVRLRRAANWRRLSAGCAIHLGEALQALGRAAESLDLPVQASAPISAVTIPDGPTL